MGQSKKKGGDDEQWKVWHSKKSTAKNVRVARAKPNPKPTKAKLAASRQCMSCFLTLCQVEAFSPARAKLHSGGNTKDGDASNESDSEGESVAASCSKLAEDAKQQPAVAEDLWK